MLGKVTLNGGDNGGAAEDADAFAGLASGSCPLAGFAESRTGDECAELDGEIGLKNLLFGDNDLALVTPVEGDKCLSNNCP